MARLSSCHGEEEPACHTFPHELGPTDAFLDGFLICQVSIGHEGFVESRSEVAKSQGLVSAEMQQLWGGSVERQYIFPGENVSRQSTMLFGFSPPYKKTMEKDVGYIHTFIYGNDLSSEVRRGWCHSRSNQRRDGDDFFLWTEGGWISCAASGSPSPCLSWAELSVSYSSSLRHYLSIIVAKRCKTKNATLCVVPLPPGRVSDRNAEELATWQSPKISARTGTSSGGSGLTPHQLPAYLGADKSSQAPACVLHLTTNTKPHILSSTTPSPELIQTTLPIPNAPAPSNN